MYKVERIYIMVVREMKDLSGSNDGKKGINSASQPIRPIKTEQDYDAALIRIEGLMNAKELCWVASALFIKPSAFRSGG